MIFLCSFSYRICVLVLSYRTRVFVTWFYGWFCYNMAGVGGRRCRSSLTFMVGRPGALGSFDYALQK